MAKRRRLQLADVLSGRPVEHGTPLVLEISEKHHDVPMRFALPGTIALLVAGSRGEAVLKRMVAAVRAEDFAELERLHLRVVQRFGRALLDPRHDVRSPHDIAAFSSFRYRRKTLRRGLCTSSGLIVARSLALYDGAELDPKAFDVLHYRRADMQGPVHAVVIVRRPRLTPLEKKIIAQLPAEAAEVHFGEDVGFFTGAIVGAAAAEVGARAIEYVAQQIGVADYIHAVEHGAQDIYNAAVNGAHDVAHAAAQEVGIEGAINVAEGVVNVTEAVTSVTADIGKAAADVAVDFVADIVGAAVDWVAHNIFTVDDGKNDAGAQGNAGAGAADAGAGANAGAGAGDDNAGNNQDNQDNAGDDFADNAGDDAGDDEGGAGKDDEGGSFKSWVDQVENVADELQSIPAAAAVRELLALRIQMINAATTGQRTSLLG